MEEVRKLLRSWGDWSNKDKDNLGYGEPMDAIMRGAPEACKEDNSLASKRYDHADFISDDEALIVDRIVRRLLAVHPVEGKCLKLKYVNRLDADAIAKGYLTRQSDKNVGKYKAAQYLATAEGFISGYIDNM